VAFTVRSAHRSDTPVDPTEARRLTSKLSGGPLAPTVN